MTTICLSSIVSRGDHRLVPVEPWVDTRLWTLRTATGQAVEHLDFTDDRLDMVLRGLNDDTCWTAFESALHQQTVRVYELPTARLHVESPSASADTTVTDAGLLPCGHSQDHRPDLPHVKGMQAVLDPLGLPLATEVVAGARADDPLYIPCIQRVQASRGRGGLLYVGDCKMASRETRALSAGQGDFYLCPLPQVQQAEGELDEALEAVWSGEQVLSPVLRQQQDGKLEQLAEGYERQVVMSLEVAGHLPHWMERR